MGKYDQMYVNIIHSDNRVIILILNEERVRDIESLPHFK